jgi:enoyl-CoA hydratase/carnithine racemase
MLLHCDYVVSSDNTLFKMPFVSLGCTPEGGASLLLPQLIGQRKAAELILLGKSFDSAYALEIGITNQVCPPGEAIEQALMIAEQMAKQPPAAIQAAKAIMKAPFTRKIRETILAEGEIFTQRLKSSEAQEAISAFIEKREPDFN